MENDRIEAEQRIGDNKQQMLSQVKEQLEKDLKYLSKVYTKCKQKDLFAKSDYDFYTLMKYDS